MTTQAHATPQQRIAEMKARAARKEARAQAERERYNRRAFRVAEVRDELLDVLKELRGLPLKPNGEAFAQFGTEDDGTVSVSVIRKGWDIDQESVYETLISFAVTADPEGAYAAVTHDGDVIDLATALDLATAAVEARFDG